MAHYTVCCGYASHYHNAVTVEADTLDAALEKAIEQAGDDPHWKSIDQANRTFVEALAEGMDADPWGDTAIPVPDRFTGEPANATGSSERANGEPPVVTLTGLHPPGGIEVAGGTVRIRFVEDDGTVTTEVTIRRPRRATNLWSPSPAEPMALRMWAVSGGRARVLILDPGDTGPPPAG